MAQSENVPVELVPVVLIHGWGGCHQDTWVKPGIDALLGDIGRQVVGVDLLGHGTAQKPHEPEAYADLGAWLLEVLPQDAPVVDVVGFSLGALTVLDALRREPSRFRRVVLAGIGDGVFDPPSPDRHDRIVAALEGRGDPSDTFAQMFVQYAEQPGNDKAALTAIMKRPVGARVTEDELATITQEVAVVIGEADFAAPADRLARSFPNGRLFVLRNTDHFATTESFAFIDVLMDFLAQ